MIPPIGDLVLAFACETAPDTAAARDGADALPGVNRRIVSVAMVRRTAARDALPEVSLLTVPKAEASAAPLPERKIVGSFLAGIGQRRPQLVGFASRGGDLRLLAQRALFLGVPARGFLQPLPGHGSVPEYLSASADCAVDLAERLAGRSFAPGESVPSLRAAAAACAIPEIADAIARPDAPDTPAGVAACTGRACCRALTVYLLWLRMAYVAGHFDACRYDEEQELLRQHLMHLSENPAYPFAEPFLEAWDTLITAAEASLR